MAPHVTINPAPQTAHTIPATGLPSTSSITTTHHPLPPPNTTNSLITSFFSLDHSIPPTTTIKKLHGSKGCRRGLRKHKDPYKKDDFSHIPPIPPSPQPPSQSRIGPYLQVKPWVSTTSNSYSTATITPTTPHTTLSHDLSTNNTQPTPNLSQTYPVTKQSTSTSTTKNLPPTTNRQQITKQSTMPPPLPRLPRTVKSLTSSSNHCMQQLPRTLPLSTSHSSTLRTHLPSEKNNIISTCKETRPLNNMYVTSIIPADENHDTDYIYTRRTLYSRLITQAPDLTSSDDEDDLPKAPPTPASHYGSITIRDTPKQIILKISNDIHPPTTKSKFYITRYLSLR